jgi:transposase-like protein
MDGKVRLACAQAMSQREAARHVIISRTIADQIRPEVPKLATLMDAAGHDVMADMSFPKEHRAKLHSTNPIEGLNGKIKRRTEVVGIAGRPSDRRQDVPCFPTTRPSSALSARCWWNRMTNGLSGAPDP